MKVRTLVTALVSLAFVALVAMQAFAAPVSILTVVYTGSTGNIKLQNTTSGSLGVQSFNIITLGNGTVGDPSGLPGNIGYLNGAAANLPSASFVTSNTSAFGLNGVSSQVFASNIGSRMFTLNAYPGWSEQDPIGPAGSYWDLGNIAPTGMTQADLDVRFLTDPELTPPNFDSQVYGKFLFTYETSPGTYSSSTVGNVVQPVPEPATSTMSTIGIVGLAAAGWTWRRRRRPT